MKKLIAALSFCLFLPLQACAQEQWQEGKHFDVIAEQATADRQVTEFFSFWCPHCYNFEPLVAQMKVRLDKEVTFNKVHVNFMRFTGPVVQDDVTRGMLVGRAMKEEAKYNAAIFNFIHVQRQAITGLEDVKRIFIENGADAAEFDKMAKSFGVNSMMQKNEKAIAQYRNYLKGVPTFIINGKYVAKFTRQMTADDMVELIVWLSKQP